MRLYQSTQVSQKKGIKNEKDRTHCWMSRPQQVIENQQQEEDDLIKPHKLINPVLACLQHRALHQELLLCHRRDVLPRRKSELQRVFENKKNEQLKKQELALQPPSDLEVHLHRRQQRLQLHEQEARKWMESLKKVPEFVKVFRQNYRDIRVWVEEPHVRDNKQSSGTATGLKNEVSRFKKATKCQVYR